MKTLITSVFLLLSYIVQPAFSALLPTLTIPTTESVGAGMATLVMQSSDSGNGYFTLLAGSGTACGTGTQVKAGHDSTGVPTRYQGSMPLNANTAGRYTVRNLMQNSTYTICFTADSPAGQNLQETPATSGVVTSAIISIANKEWGAVGGVGFSSGQASDISQAVAPDGTLYVSYQDSGIGKKATVMKYRSGVWSAVGRAGFSINPVQTTSLAFAPDGTLYIAYQDNGASNNWKATVMRFDGTNWVAVGNAGFTAGNALYTSLAFAPDGSPYIAYMDYASGFKATVMKFSNGMWSLVGNAGFSAGQAGYTSLAFSANGTPFVAYQDGGNSNKITVQKFNGSSWVPVGNVAFSAGSAWYMKFAFSPDNIPFVAFQDGGNSSKATVMKFNGSNWAPVGSAGLSPTSVGDVSLAFSPDGSPTLAIQDGSVGNKASVLQFNGTVWSVVGKSGISAGSANPVSLSFSPDGKPYVAFGDSGASWKATVMSLVNSGVTNTSIASDKTIATSGDPVTFTATVSKSAATGTISFMDGTMLLGSAPLSNGIATFNTSALTAGIHAVTAVYAGDTNYAGSTSVSQRVEICPLDIVVTSTISSPASGYITNTASITVSGTAAGVAGDPVNLVEVSADGGATWQPAVGISSWNRTISFPVEGIFVIKSRATTIMGKVETPKSGVSVTIDRTGPTGSILSAVLNDVNSVTIALNTRANTPGWGCLDYLPIVCGYQDISLSYDGVTWTPWVQALATKQYSITMVGDQNTIYAKLRDSVGNISEILSAPVKFGGSCGGADKVNYSAMPVTDLCNLGTPTEVTGIGPWFWSCTGSNGGTSTNCSSNQAGGVVFRSTDSGLTWIPTKTGAGLNTGAKPLLVSPTYASDRTLFLGAGGIYKSTNGGDTWTMTQSGYQTNSLVASPNYASDRTIFAGMFLAGVYKSTNGGTNWTTSNVGLPPSGLLFSIAISPAYSTDSTVFTYRSGMYKSTDGGATWVISGTGLSNAAVTSIAVSPAYATDRTLFAVSDHVYKSTDAGANWVVSDSGINGTFTSSVLIMSPNYPVDQTLFVTASTGVYKSTDRGANWIQVTSGSFTALALSPAYASDQTLFAGDFGVNVFNSTTGGSSWSASNSDFLTKFQLASLSVSPSYSSDHTAFTVVSLAAPMMNVTPSVLPFAPVDPNSSSLPKQVTIKNGMAGLMGSGNLAITGMTLSGAGAGDFTLAPGSCGDLKPTVAGGVSGGSQCSFDVTFTPKSPGSKSATLTITPYDVFNPQTTITLSGTGITRGVCGSDNGKTLAKAAPAPLCAAGSPSTISGSGHPWTWTCQGDAGTDPASCSATIQTYTLSLSVLADSGKGDIQADQLSNDDSPISLFCPTGHCDALFDYGRSVWLTALPDSISLFASWGGDCSADTCNVLMTAPRAVSARFTRENSFKNVSLGIPDNSLTSLLPVSNGGDEIRMLATEATIDALILDRKLTLSGGWKALYLVQDTNPTTLTGTITVKDADSSINDTTVKGGLFIQSGSLTVNRVQVSPPAIQP